MYIAHVEERERKKKGEREGGREREREREGGREGEREREGTYMVTRSRVLSCSLKNIPGRLDATCPTCKLHVLHINLYTAKTTKIERHVARSQYHILVPR